MVYHGSLRQAGKVRLNTPKVEKKEKTKIISSRVRLHKAYNKRFLSTHKSTLNLKPNSNNF